MDRLLPQLRRLILTSSLLTLVLLQAGCDNTPAPTVETEQPVTTPVPQIAGELAVGSHRPDFSLPDLDGNAHSIAEWDGKVVLVNFWATWCPPCRKEMPDFIDLKNQYGEKGFDIVGVGIDSPDAIKAFAAEIGVNYPLLHGQNEALEIIKRYGNTVGALPYSVLLNRDGKIALIRAGELKRDELETELKKYL